MTNDVYGKGLLAFLNGDKKNFFTVESDIAETEKWPISIFFRDYETMPELEKKALSLCKGSILDVGAGSGSHALWLQEKKFQVTAIDISEGAVEVMQKRGIKKVQNTDFFLLEKEKFDTLLMLMNGIGIVGYIDNLPHFFEKAKQLLLPGGKILADSSDLIYLFEDEEGNIELDLNENYYGEIEYCINFGKEKGEKFKWIFIDFETLSEYARQSGFSCKKIDEDDHYSYLAELKIM